MSQPSTKTNDGTSQQGMSLQVMGPENSSTTGQGAVIHLSNIEGNFQATRQALNLLEILTNILYHVEVNDLLLNAMRVSHFWKATIDTAPLLQQKLHFAPMPLEKQLYQDGKLLYSLCGLMAHRFCGPGKLSAQGQEESAKGRDWEKPRVFNNATVQIRFSLVKHVPGAAYPNASWRKMLLIQPPRPLVHVLSQPWKSVTETRKYKGGNSGETMGTIYDNWNRWCMDVGEGTEGYCTDSWLSSKIARMGEDGEERLTVTLHSLGFRYLGH